MVNFAAMPLLLLTLILSLNAAVPAAQAPPYTMTTYQLVMLKKGPSAAVAARGRWRLLRPIPR